MIRSVAIVSALLVFQLCSASQLLSVVSPSESTRLSSLFQGKYSDLESAYYSVLGLKSLSSGGAVGSTEKESACSLVSEADSSSISYLGLAGQLSKHLQCGHEFPQETIDFAVSQLSSENMQTLYSAVAFLQGIGQEVDATAVVGALSKSVKTQDNSVLSSSLAISAASMLPGADLADFLSTVDIEDMAAQADEVDNKYLHFENSLEITSKFLTAVFSLSEATSKAPVLSENQMIQLTNYVLRTKNSASTVKEASLILQPLGKIVASKFVTLAKGEVISGTAVSENRPSIQLLFSNLFSQPISNLNVKADAIIRASDNELLISDAAFVFDGLRLYELKVWDSKPKSGFYYVSLSIASSSGASLVGLSSLEFRVKVTAKIVVKNVQLGTADKEQSSGTLKNINYPGKMTTFKADRSQRIVMKFQIEDQTSGTLITPHQAFIRFEHRASGQDIVFVAEADKTSTYKFEVDLSVAGKDQFQSNSGLYSMSLIVGDATIANPVLWNFSDVTLKLGEDSAKSQSAMETLYAQKPEIQHKFREPEKRPPTVVSQAFTVACIMPLVAVLIAWKSIGANLNGLSLAPKNIIFHLGLGGIFVLYYMFWVKLNMFETVQYLFGIGALTFVFGNRVLSEMANSRN